MAALVLPLNIKFAKDLAKFWLPFDLNTLLRRCFCRHLPSSNSTLMSPLAQIAILRSSQAFSCLAFGFVDGFCKASIGEEHEKTHSLASLAVQTCFYVDDFMSGAESVEKTDVLRQQLCSLFSLTGMNLRKWRSNSQDLRDFIPPDLLETTDLNLPAPLSSPKALGMHWDVSQDNLHVAVPSPTQDANVTKRQVASQSAQVYDVLGLFSSVTVIPKIILQEAWKANTPWDKPVPESAAKRWNSWTSELQAISKKPVPRRINTSEKPVIFRSIHGFEDASTAAYGAVAYMRMVHEDTLVTTSLIYFKSRVALVKATMIPRLELLAAQLLAKVLSYVSKMYDMPADEIFAWTDSEIVLCQPPAAWKTFVSHRVTEIQQAVSSNKWHHVRSQDNPADLISRGVQPKALANSALWWDRPDWLRQQPEKWPTQKIMTPKRIPEAKIPSLLVTVTSTPDPFFGPSTLLTATSPELRPGCVASSGTIALPTSASLKTS